MKLAMRFNSLSPAFDSAPGSPPFFTKSLSFPGVSSNSSLDVLVILSLQLRRPALFKPSNHPSRRVGRVKKKTAPTSTGVWQGLACKARVKGFQWLWCYSLYVVCHTLFTAPMQYIRGRVLLSDAAPILSLTATDRRPSAQTVAVPQRPLGRFNACRNPRSYPSGTEAHRSPRSASAQARSRPEI